MAYTRGPTYIWSDGEYLHLWSDSGMDHWRECHFAAGNAAASGVQIAEAVANDFAVMRFAELLRSGEASEAIAKALENCKGNGGCEALEKLAPDLQALVCRIGV